jgi:hypothetical protein
VHAAAPSSASHSGLSSGQKAGIAIGTLAGAALLAGAGVLAYKKLRAQPGSPETMATFNQAFNSAA